MRGLKLRGEKSGPSSQDQITFILALHIRKTVLKCNFEEHWKQRCLFHCLEDSLCSFSCHNKIPQTRWFINNTDLFSPTSIFSNTFSPAWSCSGEAPFLGCGPDFSVSSQDRRAEEALWHLFCEILIPPWATCFQGLIPPRALPLNVGC